MDIVQDELTNNNNWLIPGDFNIHVDDEDTADTQGSVDCMNYMGLYQNVRDLKSFYASYIRPTLQWTYLCFTYR